MSSRESAEESETIEELEARAKRSADEATGMTRELTSKLTGLGLLAGADLASRKERARRQAERLAGGGRNAPAEEDEALEPGGPEDGDE